MYRSSPGRCASAPLRGAARRLASLRLLTLSSLAVLSACSPPDAALRVNVTVRAQGTTRVRADCIRLAISDDTQELKSITIRRPADDDAIFGVRRGSDLPNTVKVQATGYLGSDCSDEDTLKLNAQGEVVTGVFPESGVSEISVFLDPPNTSLDGDRDGFVGAARGGLDCKDDDSTVFPGAGQVCANTADTDCDGQTGCDDSECGTAAVCADPPDRVVITSTVSTMLRYDCVGPFRVELYNANGVRRAIRNTTVALSASLPGMRIHPTASCTQGSEVTSLPIPYDTTSFEVWLFAGPPAFGINTLTATAAQVQTPGTASVEVHPRPIDHLEFTSPPRTVTAGACSTEAVTMEFRDSDNRPTDVDAPTTITLSSAPGDVNNANIFFSDPACGTAGDMQMLTPGQGAATLYLLARRAGTFQLTATPSAGPLTTQQLTVQPAGPTKLAFTNATVALNTTQPCSAGVFTVQLQDQFDNPVNAAAALTVRVAVSGLTNVSLHHPTIPGDCTDAAQSDFTIPAGSSSVSLRAKGMVANPPTGTIAATALNLAGITDASQPVNISAGNASRFVMGGLPQSPLASVCSGGALTITLQDSAGNTASSPGPVAFTLTTVPANADPTFQFYSGAGCQMALGNSITIPAGQTGATFYYRGNRANPSFEIRASSTLAAPSTFLQGNSIRPGPPGKLVFQAPLSQTTQAGACTPSPYNARVFDLFDNATLFTTPQTVTVGSNPAGVTVGSTACNAGNSVVLEPDGGVVRFIAQHTVTNLNYGLTATVAGFSTAMPATMAVTPGPSTLIVDVPAGATSNVMAGGCQQITLSRRDMFNNNAPTSGSTPVTLQFPAGTSWNVYSNTTCSGVPGASINMNGTHTVSFSVSPRNNSAGSGTMTASILSGAQTAVVNFTVTPGAPTLVFLTPFTDAGVASAAGQAGLCQPVTIARRDNFLNDVPLGSASSVTFPSLPGGTSIFTGGGCTGTAVTSIPLLGTASRASFHVQPTRSSDTGGPAMQNVVSSLAAQSATLTLTVSPQTSSTDLSVSFPDGGTASLQAYECQRINTERRDGYGNLVPAIGANMTIDGGADAGGLEVFASTNCTGTPATTPTVSYTAGASNRDFSVRVRLASATPRNYTLHHEGLSEQLSLTISPAATSTFEILTLPPQMTSGTCIGPFTLRRRDAYTNETTSGTISVTMASTGAAPVTFSPAADCSGATPTLGVNIADGSSTSGNFYLTATQAAAATITATQGSAMGTGNFTVIAGPPHELRFTTPVRTFTGSVCGGSTNVITVQLRDVAGNVAVAPSGGTALTITSTSAGGTFANNDQCMSATATPNFSVPQGASTFSFYYRDTVLGTPTVSVTSSLNTNPAPQVHSVVPGPATRLSFTTPPRTFTAAQCGANEITVQLQDVNNYPVNAGTGGRTFTAVTSSPGPAAWFTDPGCVTPAVGGSFTIPSGSNSVSLFYRDDRAGSPTITLTTGLTPPPGQVHTVNEGPPAKLAFTSTAQTLNALSCSAQVTVTMQDAGGNTVNAGMNRTIQLSASAGPNVTFYSNNSCGTAIPSDQLTMNSGNSSVTFYFRAENAGSSTLAADTTSIAQGTQVATFNAAPVTQLNITTTPPATIEAGFCQPITVERLDELNRQVTTGTTTITPTPLTGAQFFSDASCTVGLGTTFNIGVGASSATIYFKGITAQLSGVIPENRTFTVTLTTGSITDNVGITVQPMVRRKNSTCTIANSSSTTTCTISPTLADATRTILFFQAIPTNDDDPGDDNVTCRLDPNGGTAQVVCDRDGTAGAVTIEWQTASFPYSYANGGVSVQHVTGGCTGNAMNTMPLDVPISNAPTANSFVLFSSRTNGNDNDGEHFFTARLTSATNLQFNQSGTSTTCTRTVAFDAQVVSWTNATVTPGVTSGGSGATFTPGTTGASSPVFLLYSSRLVDSNNQNICRRRLRGEITNATTLGFNRGCTGADLQDIAWQHVRLPGAATVQQVHGNMSGATGSGNLAISAIDLTRTVGFLGGMGPGGTAGGSTTYSMTDRLGAAVARVNFNNNAQVVYTRGVNNDAASFTGYIVQLSP